MRPLLEEQETIIRIGRTEKTAIISTTDSVYMNKFDKLCEGSEEWKCTGVETCQGDVVEKFYECPKKFVSFRSKTVKPNLTEEQRQASAERLRKLRESKI